ncbi:MAG: putative bifunctional diguanylate cyclase/phosphodiesterase [Acidimicrobiales bacterium]
MARRLLLILLIPLLGFGAFVARVYLDRQDERAHQDDAAVALRLVVDLGGLVDALDADVRRDRAGLGEPVDAARLVDEVSDARLSLAAVVGSGEVEATDDVHDALAAVEQMLDSPTVDGYLDAMVEVEDAMVGLASLPVLSNVTAVLVAHHGLIELRTRATTEQTIVVAVIDTGEWPDGDNQRAVELAEGEAARLDLLVGLAGPAAVPSPPARLTETRARLAREGTRGVPDLTSDEWLTISDEWRTELTEASDQQLSESATTVSSEQSAASDRMRSTVILGSLVMVVSAGAALGGTIIHDRRVQRLKRHMVEVAEGNLDLEPIADTNRDEISVIAQAFDDMTEAVRRAVASEMAEAAILEQIARGGEVNAVLTMIADLATEQTGVQHQIVLEDPGLNTAEPIRMNETDQPVAWLVRIGAEPLTGPRPPIVTTCVGLALLAFERDRTDQTLTYQATHDVLTGLANRAVLLRETERALKRTGPGRTAVLYCDLDGFKAVNDAHGHRAGDRLLVDAATRLRAVVGTRGLLARVGGDEFVALLPEINTVEAATAVADEILEAVAAPFHHEPTSMFLSVSVGIALGGVGSTAEDLVRDSDLALYRAKAAGRARWELFDDELGQWAAQRVETANALRAALDEDQIELWYQPVFGIAGGLVGFEGLVRWNRPGYGIVSPADFLSVAEETGMIIPLGERVLTEGCRQLAAWTRAVPEIPTVLSLNMSGAQLIHAEFAPGVGDALSDAGASANRLQVEITETVLLENRVEAASTLALLRRMGVRVAIDDFGTGYSSLAYLRELPVDLLKVDRAFIDGIEESAEDQAIVRAVITLAEALDMVVIAEGVERPEQLRELKRLGCRYVQGFLMGRPMTAFAATKLLEDELAAKTATTGGSATRDNVPGRRS